MSDWARNAVFYHLYPLGALGAPERNDFRSPPSGRLEVLHEWLDPLAELGINAIYFGPAFESTAHGYDTADYYTVDRRLGDNAALARWSQALHQRGMRLVLDGVFNHVGRDFWAFRDVQRHGANSPYASWFHLDFGRRSPYGDPFGYEGWNGHYDLVKLNTHHPGVKEHLFGAVRDWIERYSIDGLRLDAADVLDKGFQQELAAFCRSLQPDFWLLGEVIHGDYREWAETAKLDSVTNYELYKGLYSSHNDRNYFELAHSLNRQFGGAGLYRDMPLYSFLDNHDVDRIASRLYEPKHLYPLHGLLFTVPGVPSIYYGSEVGVLGKKGHNTDAPLRPVFHPRTGQHQGSQPDLPSAISCFARLRQRHPALRYGAYQQLHVASEQFAFMRTLAGERLVIAVNSADCPVEVKLAFDGHAVTQLVDALNGDECFEVKGGCASVTLPPNWIRIMKAELSVPTF